MLPYLCFIKQRSNDAALNKVKEKTMKNLTETNVQEVDGFKIGDKVRDIVTGLVGVIYKIDKDETATDRLLVDCPENAKRKREDGHPCPRMYWTSPDSLIHKRIDA